MVDPYFDQPGRDGRRKSDPLKDPDNAPAAAPDWQLYRKISVIDPASILTQERIGLNMGHYDRLRLQVALFTDETLDTPVVPGAGGTNATIEILAWNPQMKKFLPITDADPTLTFSASGAGVSFTTEEIRAFGSLLLIKLNSAPQNGEVVAIYAQGYGLDHSL